LQGGIPVLQALESAGPTSGSDLVAKAVTDAVKQIEEGNGVSQPLEKSGLFPPMVTNMIAVGEEAGTLPELLDKIAEFYEEDVASLTKSLGSMIEPIMLILIGIVVGGMLLSLYLPIFTAVTSSV
jgi:type IV pilus assembly protein PilC